MSKRNKRYFWLSAQQMRRLQPFFPQVRGRARSDDCKVPSGIIYDGLRWQDAPSVCGPCKTLYNRFARWSRMGIFARIFQELAQPGGHGDTLMIDIEPVLRHRFEQDRRGFMKAHRTATSLRKSEDQETTRWIVSPRDGIIRG